ncbi:hypothetical protein STSP2_01477 [Anaerohalosphaera lusitana]|uniref:Uncharacterized protein n=1 Tax=Anaerohalosphaera lusitana TaxID=1936003 RepID=A0A1U9NKQ8_9BACT|nr:hypothetical protein [Anaerohalosphaera lusitana]AQT68318.1 hypothetical protein STSP2_01477 [Anaerohalosphaera lusitana]
MLISLMKSKRFVVFGVAVLAAVVVFAANTSAAPEDQTDGFLDPFSLTVSSYSTDSDAQSFDPTVSSAMFEGFTDVSGSVDSTEATVVEISMPRPPIVPYRPRPRSPIRF